MGEIEEKYVTTETEVVQMSMKQRLLAVKSVEYMVSQGEESELKRELNYWDLTFIGIGGIIGTGIFVLSGVAAALYAGPAVVVSFIVAGIASGFAALSYAELASMIPIAGSAYTYSYATMGELVAWIIGWDLIIEYLFGAAAVAVGWSAYFVSFFASVGVTLDERWTSPPVNWNEDTQSFTPSGDYINLPGMVIVGFLTMILVFGIRESKMANNVIVILKLFVVVLFILAVCKFVSKDNLTPFVPPSQGDWHQFGVGGIFAAAQQVFFAYIGFDSVTTAAQEAKNPQRDLPIGIMLSLAICTILYILTSLVMTGSTPYHLLNVPAPISVVTNYVKLPWLTVIVNLGAILGLTSVMLISLLGQSRIFYSMAFDGLLPPVFAKVHHKYKTPYVPTILSGVVTALLGGLLPVDILGNMTSVGTLLAFVLVHIGVIILRFSRPDAERKFQIPGPGKTWMISPIFGAIISLVLIAVSEYQTIYRVVIWMALGLIVYASYGYKHSKVRLGEPQEKPAFSDGH